MFSDNYSLAESDIEYKTNSLLEEQIKSFFKNDAQDIPYDFIKFENQGKSASLFYFFNKDKKFLLKIYDRGRSPQKVSLPRSDLYEDVLFSFIINNDIHVQVIRFLVDYISLYEYIETILYIAPTIYGYSYSEKKELLIINNFP